MSQLDIDLYWLAAILQIAAIAYCIGMMRVANDRRPWIAMLTALSIMMVARIMATMIPLAERAHINPFIAPVISLALLLALYTMREVAIAEKQSREIADRRTQERDESEKRYHALVELSPDAILVFSSDKVVYANAAAAGLIGANSVQDLLERKSSQLLSSQSLTIFANEARMLHDVGQTLPSSEQAWLKLDGSLAWVDAVAAMVPWHGGVAIQYILRDASERKRIEQRRSAMLADERAARSAAEHASRMKDEFLATLSHELRTPLNAILGWSQVLRRMPNPDADLTQGLDTIERNARSQTRLIEDLLDMSRITSGKLSLTIAKLTPSQVINAAMETVRHAAAAKGVSLLADFEPAADTVMADTNRLQQVIWNLLTNAVKFTPAGGEVKVSLRRTAEAVQIIVADSGQGISKQFLPQVFERFKQADSTTTRRHGGLGLGLAIARQLVEMHGGTLTAASEGEGHGSTFTVELPATGISPLRGETLDHAGASNGQAARPEFSSTKDDSAALSEHVQRIDLTGLKVLVVDDEADTRAPIKRFLDRCNANVTTVGSANEAMEAIAAATPDVLISDIGMPVIDGYELIRRVRASENGHGGKIPAIALTAFARSEDRTRALLAGYTVHISKPVEAEELLATLASVAGRVAQGAAH